MLLRLGDDLTALFLNKHDTLASTTLAFVNYQQSDMKKLPILTSRSHLKNQPISYNLIANLFLNLTNSNYLLYFFQAYYDVLRQEMDKSYLEYPEEINSPKAKAMATAVTDLPKNVNLLKTVINLWNQSFYW